MPITYPRTYEVQIRHRCPHDNVRAGICLTCGGRQIAPGGLFVHQAPRDGYIYEWIELGVLLGERKRRPTT